MAAGAIEIDQLTFQDLPECVGCGLYRPIEPGEEKHFLAGKADPIWPALACRLCAGERAPRVKKRRKGGRYGGGGVA